MPKDNLDDLNNDENLDFLEEEHANDTNVYSTNPNVSNNILQYLPLDKLKTYKKPLLILGASVLGISILLMFKNHKSEQILVSPTVNTQTAKTNPPATTTSHSYPNHVNAKPSENNIAASNSLNKDQTATKDLAATSINPSGAINNNLTNNPQPTNTQINNLSPQSPPPTNLQELPNLTQQVMPENLTESIASISASSQSIEKLEPEYVQELKNIIAKLNQELIINTEQIKELQNNLLNISKALATMQFSINNMDNKMLNLNQNVDHLTMDVKNVKKYIQEEDLDLATNLKTTEPDLFSNTPEYVIHAVIPGRAWLKSATGQIITVTEGDPLGDYGKVAFIDAVNNIIRTSSGVVFR